MSDRNETALSLGHRVAISIAAPAGKVWGRLTDARGRACEGGA